MSTLWIVWSFREFISNINFIVPFCLGGKVYCFLSVSSFLSDKLQVHFSFTCAIYREFSLWGIDRPNSCGMLSTIIWKIFGVRIFCAQKLNTQMLHLISSGKFLHIVQYYKKNCNTKFLHMKIFVCKIFLNYTSSLCQCEWRCVLCMGIGLSCLLISNVGFGLCGIPENLIEALRDKGVANLIVTSNNAG